MSIRSSDICRTWELLDYNHQKTTHENINLSTENKGILNVNYIMKNYFLWKIFRM